MVVCYSCVTEQLIVKYIIPASGCNSIPPVDIDFAVIEIQARTIVITVVFLTPCVIIMVFSFIKAEEESASVGKLMVYFSIYIIEVIVVFFILRQKRSCHQVQIGAASCQTERSFVFYDRSFKMQLTG